MNKLAFVINNVDFLLSHRLPILLAAQRQGYEIFVIAPNAENDDRLKQYGVSCHNITLSRGGNNPITDINTTFQLTRIFKKIRPDIAHLVTIKPVLYGGLAARLSKVPAVVAAVSGLGTVFLSKGIVSYIRRWFVAKLYRIAFKQKKIAVIFQNPDDRKLILGLKALEKSQAHIIRGSGVDLNNYPFRSEALQNTIVVMAARLLRDKGVYEFVEAARILKSREIAVEMRLIGAPDPCNPTSITEDELKAWQKDRLVSLLGYRSDIAEQYAQANIICLPSYREGLPKGLVEAAACGRAVVTTDVPGCRDAIEAGVTGILVKVRDAVALADAIQRLYEHPDERIRMGIAGRNLAERAFSIDEIVEQHLTIYRHLQ